MKKLFAATSAFISYLVNTTQLLAIQVAPPKGVGIDPNATTPSVILKSALNIVYVAAIILVLFYLIWGAFKWITSGGDKEAVSGARKTIVAALVGLAILALALVIVVIVGKILNINILGDFVIFNLEGTKTDI